MAKKTNKKFDFRSIKTFEDACKAVNVNPEKIPVTSDIPEEFSKPVIAHYKLIIIFMAINNGWKPDWSDRNEYKYYPWFWVLSSGFGFSFSAYYCAYTDAYVGSRLCTDTREKALYIAEQFEDLYKEYLLYSE